MYSDLHRSKVIDKPNHNQCNIFKCKLAQKMMTSSSHLQLTLPCTTTHPIHLDLGVQNNYHVENAMMAKSHWRIRMAPRGSFKTRVSITVDPMG